MKNNTKNQFWSNSWKILKQTVMGFLDEDCLKLSASLAYYTVFSIGPILLIMISLAGIFYGEDAIKGKVFSEINGLVGTKVAYQIQDIIKNLELSGKSNSTLIISIITLVIGATTVFADMQSSINKVWHVRAKAKKGWLKLIMDRLLSSSLIIGLGFLLMVTLMINGVVIALMEYLRAYNPAFSVVLFDAFNLLLSLGLVFLLFSIIFKVLPDVSIQWRTVRAGAIFTTILFFFGRWIIGFYIQNSDTETTYGTAGSMIILILWVYYTAAILYFGAVFTREFATVMGIPIQPSDYAVYVEVKEVEKNNCNVVEADE